jgi:hypothetical protein
VASVISLSQPHRFRIVLVVGLRTPGGPNRAQATEPPPAQLAAVSGLRSLGWSGSWLIETVSRVLSLGVEVPHGPGNGVKVDQDHLGRYRTSHLAMARRWPAPAASVRFTVRVFAGDPNRFGVWVTPWRDQPLGKDGARADPGLPERSPFPASRGAPRTWASTWAANSSSNRSLCLSN